MSNLRNTARIGGVASSGTPTVAWRSATPQPLGVGGGLRDTQTSASSYRLQTEKLQHWRLKYGGTSNQAVT